MQSFSISNQESVPCLSNPYLFSVYCLKCCWTSSRPKYTSEAVVVMIAWYLDLRQPMQSVHITTKVARSNHGHGWRGVLYAALCNKVCQWLLVGWWFSPGSLGFSSTNNTDRDDIIELFVKVVLNTTTSLDMHDISASCIINKRIANIIILVRYVVSSVV